MKTPALAEHSRYRLEGVRTSDGFVPLDDFTAQAVLSVCTRLTHWQTCAVVDQEAANRERIGVRHVCGRCGCLLVNGETCPGCRAGFLL